MGLDEKTMETLSDIAAVTITTALLKRRLRIAEVQACVVLPGLYPPNAETKAPYETFRGGNA